MYFIFLIFFLPINFFACSRVRYLEIEEPKIVPSLILHLNGLVPKTRAGKVSFVQRVEHTINSKEPASLKCQAMRAFLKKSPTKEQILYLRLPIELKEQILAQEQLMEEYYKDVSLCLTQGFRGDYRAEKSVCVLDILTSFAAEEKTSFYFLETLRITEKLKKEFFDRGFSSYYGHVDHTVGEELLTKAVMSSNYNFVNWLLQFGVDPNYSTREASMIEYAVRNDRPDILKLLVANGAFVTGFYTLQGYQCNGPLLKACNHGRYNSVALLISLGADVNEVDEQDRSILMKTVEGRGPENGKCINLLVQNGARVELKDKKGCTALFYAVNHWGGKEESAAMLLQNGAQVDVRDLNFQTPLMYASRKDNLPGVKLLLLAGADINAKDSQGDNALFHSVKNYNYVKDILPMVTTLVEHQIDVNATDNSGLNVVDHALEEYKIIRKAGSSTKECEKVIRYLMSKKPKLTFSMRLAVFYHLNRRKIWASAFCVSALMGGAYFYKKKF